MNDASSLLADTGHAWEMGDAHVIHRALTDVDLAHVLALLDVAAVPDEAARHLLGALLELHGQPSSAVDYSPEHGETYVARQRHLHERIGDHAGWLDLGRTRREAVRTAFRMVLREQLLDLVEGAASFASAAADLSEQHVDTLMPDYTYLQRAQATTFGHYVLSFAFPVLRDAERLLIEHDHVNLAPTGVGGASGSSIIRDRDGTARTLGFDGAILHMRDAMWQSDPLVHALAIAVTLATTQDKLAEDLEIFSSEEFGFVALADALCRPSVMMPQKRNPYALSVIRGTTGILIGRLTGQMAVHKSPSARSDGLIYTFGEVSRGLDLARQVLRLGTAVVAGLDVDRARMMSALATGGTEAADVAALLTRVGGVDYRTAHRIVRTALDTARAHPKGSGALVVADLLAAAHQVGVRDLRVSDDDLHECVDPARSLAARSGRAVPRRRMPWR
jgi:argininosuccinate lyase